MDPSELQELDELGSLGAPAPQQDPGEGALVAAASAHADELEDLGEVLALAVPQPQAGQARGYRQRSWELLAHARDTKSRKRPRLVPNGPSRLGAQWRTP